MALIGIFGLMRTVARVEHAEDEEKKYRVRIEICLNKSAIGSDLVDARTAARFL